jgi:hypothetical protein
MFWKCDQGGMATRKAKSYSGLDLCQVKFENESHEPTSDTKRSQTEAKVSIN